MPADALHAVPQLRDGRQLAAEGTIITSGTVLLATGSLYVFGGGAINDFAFTFLIGILTGTYSSIYIASAFVLWWHKGQRPNIGGSAVTMQNAAPVKP